MSAVVLDRDFLNNDWLFPQRSGVTRFKPHRQLAHILRKGVERSCSYNCQRKPRGGKVHRWHRELRGTFPLREDPGVPRLPTSYWSGSTTPYPVVLIPVSLCAHQPRRASAVSSPNKSQNRSLVASTVASTVEGSCVSKHNTYQHRTSSCHINTIRRRQRSISNSRHSAGRSHAFSIAHRLSFNEGKCQRHWQAKRAEDSKKVPEHFTNRQVITVQSSTN